MDFLTFLSIIVPAAFHAWPLVVLVVIVIFRKSFVNLASRIRTVKWKDGEIRFDKQGLSKRRAPRVQNTTIAPPCGALRINVFDPVCVGSDVTVQLTGGAIRASGGRLIGSLS
jgi:hypothetical protein